jgi:zinc D-Ala-D-Ala dipeptidase
LFANESGALGNLPDWKHLVAFFQAAELTRMKPYQRIPIVECGEPLLPIPKGLFVLEEPHPYVKLGAPYGMQSPYFLRKSVLESLIAAQAFLQQQRPGWRIQIFDAYRPIGVQQFMVDYAIAESVRAKGLVLEQLTPAQKQEVLDQVYQFWAVPSHDPMTPPPHSTGAAIDVTLLDENKHVIDMGSPIDEISPRSYPDHFASLANLAQEENLRDRAMLIHRHRQLLRESMLRAGFRQHPNEWWHFSLGDQMWAWQMNRESSETMLVARYGAV